MSIKLTLAILASLVLPAAAMAQGQVAPQKLNAVLCKTEAQAIAFASSMAGGQTEPMAVKERGRIQAQCCQISLAVAEFVTSSRKTFLPCQS